MNNITTAVVGLMLVVLYLVHQDLQQIKDTQVKQLSINENQAVNFQTISKRLDVTEMDRLQEVKLLKNKETLGDLSCGKCHNGDRNALPLTRISIEEAYDIVRNGNENTRNKGMPLYTNINTGKQNKPVISDSVLRSSLEKLYTPELLRTAKDVSR